MKIIFVIILLAISSIAYTQNSEGVKIGSTVSPPNRSTMFEVQSSNKGVLFPKIELTDISVYAPIVGSETEGVLVYNTNATIVGGCGTGYYFWNGNYWERMGKKCILQMSFVDMIAFTANLGPSDVGFQVYVTDASISSSDLSPCLASTCTPVTVNPQGFWTFTNVKLITCTCGGVYWSKDVPLPTISCSGTNC